MIFTKIKALSRGSPLTPAPNRTVHPGLLWLGLVAVLLAACSEEEQPPIIRQVTSWAVQLQGYWTAGALDRLDQSSYELLILDAPVLNQPPAGLDTRALVERLHRSAAQEGRLRLVLAYLNIGQAESWRYYWTSAWKPPAAGKPGSPDFILADDPDGWADNYMVAYWDSRWQALLMGGSDTMLERILAAGFDGVLLDWVDGYNQAKVKAAAKAAGKDAALEMVRLVRALAETARASRPGFLVVPQNALDLAGRYPDYLAAIDGATQEHLFFTGTPGTSWTDPKACDIPVDATTRSYFLGRLPPLLGAGKPVFNLEYACQAQNQAQARSLSQQAGTTVFVSRIPLDRLPEN